MSAFNKMKSILFFIFLLSQIILISSTDCPEGQIFDNSQNSCTEYFTPDSPCEGTYGCNNENDETCISGVCACKQNRFLNEKKNRCLLPLRYVKECYDCSDHVGASCNLSNQCVCEKTPYKYSLDKNEIECFMVIPEKYCEEDVPCKKLSELSICDTTKKNACVWMVIVLILVKINVYQF